ncbi:MAG: extracellular solute-binding protein [Lachnospiraceae bacterium]|nr:extracellular solute-binding protein [Lachnospiraceae bacterium]
MIRKSMKKVISLLLAASLVFTMAGCGGGSNGGQGTNTDSTGDSAKTDGNGTGSDNAGEDGPTAMGRYVEEELDLSEQVSAPGATDLCVREDGSFVIMDREVGMLVSENQGATWNVETPDWFADYQDYWISSLNMSPDGTVALMHYVGDSNAEDPEWRLILILPDGTQVPVEAELSEDDMYFRQVVMGDDNRIFVSAGRGIYEVQRDGSTEKILTIDFTPSWVWVKDNLLFIDNEWELEDAPVIYDMEAGEYIEDEVLAEFTGDSYQDRGYNGTDYCDMYLLPGENGTVYLAGKKGIHRHVIGGNMMEQILDGNLSLLSNPHYAIIDMIQLEGDAFLALIVGGKLIRFTYDPNVPAVPENMITIYSLREDDNIRQAISLYQTKHPDVFVSYQIGMSDGDSVTREDAVKKLNTEIMAGEGPDLLVLDELPFDSYVDKGMLLDLTDYLAEYSTKEPLFDNVIEALKRDGKAYMAPATLAVPQIVCGAEGMENVTNLSDLGGIIEKLREENPGNDIIGVSGERGVMKRFAGASEPEWISEDGTINRDIIAEYLEQCERIFDAQMDGLDEERLEYYEGRNERMAEFYGKKMDEMDWEAFMDTMQYVSKEVRMLSGWTMSQYAYLEMISVDDNKGTEDAKLVPMQGQCSHVFMPVTMLAVSAASGQTDEALGFMDAFLSADVQSAYDGLPLNQNAFDMQFTPQEDHLQEDGAYSSVATTDMDGNTIEFTSYWPSDEEIAGFKEELASVNTAYIPDQMLEDAVFTQGISYMRGEQSMEQTLDEIEKAVAIYMAE